jgi:hypothetical protein
MQQQAYSFALTKPVLLYALCKDNYPSTFLLVTSRNCSLENDRLVITLLHALSTFDMERLAVASDVRVSYYQSKSLALCVWRNSTLDGNEVSLPVAWRKPAVL